MSRSGPPRARRGATPPTVSPLLLRWFVRYARWYVGRSFHRLRASGLEALDAVRGSPLVVYLNHPSWWDPLVCLLLARHCFPERHAYGPIDAGALRRYRFFSKLGFFGVEPNAARGAQVFLRTGGAVLERTDAALWVTAQGRFADVRERPLRLSQGIAHLALRHPEAWFLPLAVEYCFWEERFPELLVRWGAPVRIGEASTVEACHARLEHALVDAMDRLAEDAVARRREAFVPLFTGRAGVGGVYDLWHRVQARLGGRRYDPSHGAERLEW